MPDTAIILAKGSHSGDCADPQRCLFEWYNWLTRQQHTDDRPPGVSSILHRFGMSLNDLLPDDTRQQLTRFLPNGADRLAGTASDGKDETRGYLALDWLIRVYLPAWLDLAGLGEAALLRALAPVADLDAARAAGLVVRSARDKAAAAGAAAGAAAWAAARDAARAAAGDAAWAAARDAARAAAGDAAWDAAGAVAWDAAGAVAWDAAGAAAGAAAGDAARAKLAPTVTLLQADAIRLYEAMIDA